LCKTFKKTGRGESKFAPQATPRQAGKKEKKKKRSFVWAEGLASRKEALETQQLGDETVLVGKNGQKPNFSATLVGLPAGRAFGPLMSGRRGWTQMKVTHGTDPRLL